MAILRILSSQQTDTRVRPLEPYRKCRNCGPPTQSSVASIICCAPQIVSLFRATLQDLSSKADRVSQESDDIVSPLYPEQPSNTVLFLLLTKVSRRSLRGSAPDRIVSCLF